MTLDVIKRTVDNNQILSKANDSPPHLFLKTQDSPPRDGTSGIIATVENEE